MNDNSSYQDDEAVLEAQAAELSALSMTVEIFETATEAASFNADLAHRRRALTQFCEARNLLPDHLYAEAILTRWNAWFDAMANGNLTKENNPDVYRAIATGPIKASWIQNWSA